ncbi:MAG TPA: hypothetical protein VG898_05005 [Solirubrobacterales bacterium]|nr:hypothetical protein [Solirubrobacterales bacterium]
MEESRNPFRFSEPVPADELLDREEEARTLLERAHGGNNSRLAAPRRFGKTSLLTRVIEDARRDGWAAVYVDFFGVLTLDDVARRIERAYSEQLRGRSATWFAGARRMLRPTLRVGGGPVPAGLEVSVDPQAEPPLLERLALPARLFERHGTRSLIVFDEFQDILVTKERADAVIRSEIQHHGDAASYVFAGSHVGMMRELFSDRRRAFYGQAGPLELPPLPADEVADYLVLRFEASGREVGPALAPLLDAARGHPQRTMLLAHLLWELTPEGGEATEEIWLSAYDEAMHHVRDELRVAWSALPASQRRVLTGIAENREGVYAAGRRQGGSRGGAVRTALEALRDRGDVVEDADTVSGWRLVDPLLAAWVNEGRPGA